MNLNFSISELIRSDVAVKHNIINMPNEECLDNLLNLIYFCLQPARELLNRPMIITSGYRNTRLNYLVGGKTNSQHTKGQAADFYVNNMSIESVIDKIRKSNIEYDQLINEYNRWVHISYNRNHNRRQILHIS